jgi:hypothetical protein
MIYVTVTPYHRVENMGSVKGKIHSAKSRIGNFQYDFVTPVELNADRSLMLELPENQMYNLNIVYDPAIDKYMYAEFDIINSLDSATYYVKFEKKKGEFVVLPQEGRFGKTTEGYSLKNNVKLSKDAKQLGREIAQKAPFYDKKPINFE